MIEVFLEEFFFSEASIIIFNQNFSRDWSSNSTDESETSRERSQDSRDESKLIKEQ